MLFRQSLGTDAQTGQMSKKQQKKRLPPEERKKQLLEIAVEVFADRGISVARHAEISERAGVSVATIFFYFPSRELLVDAVLTETERVFVDLPEIIDVDPGIKVIRQLLLNFMAYIEKYPNHSRILFEWSASIRDDVWPRFLRLQDQLIESMAEQIAEERIGQPAKGAATPEEIARLLMGVAYTLYIMKFSGIPDQDIAKFADGLVETLG